MTKVELARTNLTDEEVVFLEEWLTRFDSVTVLNLMKNPFSGEGVPRACRLHSCCGLLKIEAHLFSSVELVADDNTR